MCGGVGCTPTQEEPMSDELLQEELGQYLAQLNAAKQRKNEAEAEIQSLTKLLTESMTAGEMRKLQTNVPDGILIGTLVTPSTVEIDEPRLKRQLGAKVWKKVTKQVLDRKLLDDALSTGEVDIAVVAQCSQEKFRSPYIKLTTKVDK